MNFQWYPGHMTKAKRQMQEDIKLIDLVIELVDARIPLSSRNPDIDELGKNKYRLILMNKADLADRKATEQWSAFFKKKGYYVVSLDARSKNGMKSIADIIMEACKEKMERDRKRGIKNRPVRAMVVGIPNVGKSTFLSRVTNAQPKIANYHFTTLSPNLGVVDTANGGFVIADIPGLIEGASEGVGLGHEFLRHIERTRVLVHIVDAASTEGRDPIDDIYKINHELEAYNPEIAARPQLIAANKVDCIFDGDDENPIEKLRAEFEPKGIKVYPISAVTGQGIKELLFAIKDLLLSVPAERIVFEQEFFPEDELFTENLPFTVERLPEDPEIFVVEGPKIEKMLGYTNLDSEKGFAFFQRFLKEGGILEELEKAGIEEGNTVRMYGFDFDYYK